MTAITSADAAMLTVYPTGDNSFMIYGSALEGVNGIELTIAYDTPELHDPDVSQGALIAGALMKDNPTIPGEIGVAILPTSLLSGSGELISIQFALSAENGVISAVKAKLIDETFAVLPVTVTIADHSFCENSGSATIAAVQSAINMFLGLKPAELCVDSDYNGAVSIAEAQQVINGFLGL
jgi:hypothetical protein